MSLTVAATMHSSRLLERTVRPDFERCRHDWCIFPLGSSILQMIELAGSPMGVRSMWLTVGEAVRDNLSTLSREVVHVVCGTPGRCLDIAMRGDLKLEKVRVVVIRGADEILSRGFADVIQELWSSGMPSEVQVAVFSETMPPEVEALARYTRDPVRLLVLEKRTLDRVEQFYVPVGAGDERARVEVLWATLDRLKITQAVVYCSSRRSVEWVAAQLTERGVAVALSHAEASLVEREAAMAALRMGTARLLVTTDGCTRGEDVHVTVFINYELPADVPAYVARVWRAGRFGHKAVAINLIADGDAPLGDNRFQADVEKRYSTPWRSLDEMPAAVAETL
jgi:superfamily II DNA/RNA helicase